MPTRSGMLARGRPIFARLPTLLLIGAALTGSVSASGAAPADGEKPVLRGSSQPGADDTKGGGKDDKKPETDSQDLFGFTIGSDIGDVGETELSLDTQLRAARRGGRYRVWSPTLALEHVPVENFSFTGSIGFDSFQIRGVQGLDDRSSGGVSEIGAEFKYAVLTRKQDGIGLTLSAAPQLGFVEDDSGERGTRTAVELRLSADTELVPNRVFGALNITYEPEVFRFRSPVDSSGDLRPAERDSTLGVAGALTFRLSDAVFAGGELRYFRKYEGLAFRSFQGEAVYLGPTFYWQLAEKVGLSAAWNIQVAGHAKGQPGQLDLDDFDRHQARLKLKVSF